MRIDEKIQEIEKYIEELDSFISEDFEDYKSNIQLKAACERYFEKIIEAVIDLSFLIIKDRNLEKPEDDNDVFNILYKNKVISKDLCEKLKDAKGMKNIISHQYGSIDDEMVFNSITEELKDDVNNFLDEIREFYADS